MIIYTLKGKKENVKSQIEGRRGGGCKGFWCGVAVIFISKYSIAVLQSPSSVR